MEIPGGQFPMNIPFNILNQLLNMNNIQNEPQPQKYTIMNIFKEIDSTELLTKDNSFFNKIHSETKEISLYLLDSIKKFHLLFNKDLHNFEESLKFIESISIPNKCICAGVIEKISGWRCNDCSKYENCIYCNDCYLKSKHLHKNHNVFFLYDATGMCDCGDPDSLYIYCPEHSGPFKDQKEINDYISKVFDKDILNKLKEFFEALFLRFSKYLVLTEKFDLFCRYYFDEKFSNIDNNNKDLLNERDDVVLLKKNFSIVFQNLMHFLRLISQKNIGMLHLIANFFLNIHLENQKLEDEYMSTHRCLKITEDNIQLFYSDNKKHICVCPFFRLFMTNYRDGFGFRNENSEFLLSFAHNLPLRNSLCIIYFATYEQMLLNSNEDFILNRNQFYLEDTTYFIAEKSNLIEESYEILYQYLLKYFNSPKIKTNYGGINNAIIDKIFNPVIHMNTDTKYFSKPKMRKLMTEKTSIVKRVVDIICLIHNQNEIKSILPHPEFQNKGFSQSLLFFEFRLLGIVEEITMYIEWEKMAELKDIFSYIIQKIINQEKEGIKILQDDEYSYHLSLYRCFGILLNSFCFNYAFINDCTLIDSIEIFKKMFSSENEVKSLVDIILKDYFKFFGFIGGCINNYFNYYETLSAYFRAYFYLKQSYFIDCSLLKYILIMTEKIDIISFLKRSNIENVFNSFEKAFILKESIKKEDIRETKEEANKEKNIPNDNNLQPGEINLQLLELLRNQNQRQITPLVFEQLINNSNYNRNKDKSIDENNCLMQWVFLLDLLIIIMKDDSSSFWSLMRIYKDSISSKTKRELFNDVKNNKFAMQDLKNILKEKLIQVIITQGNLTNLENIIKNIDEHLKILFEDNEFNKILDDLTYNKMNGEIKMFYLKDCNFKYLDLNYFISNKDKSKAQKYILDFKKDVVKSYNSYYFNPSKLTFDLFETVFEKILLDKDNLLLLLKMLEKLLSDQSITEELDIKSVRNSLLPVILNYLSIFGEINSKSFIEFKINNNDLINQLIQLLNNMIKKNKNNIILEKDLEENVKVVIDQLNIFKNIYEYINKDLSKLSRYDYNTEFLEKIKEKENVVNYSIKVNLLKRDNNKIDENKKKVKNMKDKFKNLMIKKSNLFMNKVSSNKEMLQAINEQNNNTKKEDINNEIMCFFCRNPIKLDTFEVSYGKIGLLIEDYFYINSFKATLRAELSKLMKGYKNKNELCEQIIQNVYNDVYNRIISCGHYFHTSCFKEGCAKNNENNNNNESNEFLCPLCLKKQNILIPPLNEFKEKNIFFATETIEEIFNNKIDINKYKSNNDSSLFKDIIEEFLEKIDLNILKNKNYISFLDYKYPQLKGFFNFLENIFYLNTTTFHKQQQIDTFQNIILSLRFIIKANPFYIDQIIKFIRDELENLAKGPNKDYIFQHTDYMKYANSLEKILLSLSILFNYDEMKDTFKYIIFIYLPYFAFGFYFRDLIMKKEFKNMDKFKFKEKMNINDLQLYLNDNKNSIINYFSSFLKKFCLIKVITDFSNKNQEIINSFNELTLDNLFSLLGMEELFLIVSKNNKNEIKLMDIIQNLHSIFNKNDLFFKLFGNNFDYNKVIGSIFSNIKLNNKDESISENELIIQFSPIKFDFTYLDENIFDWIERNIGKPCDMCKQITKYSFICLICGDKVCKENLNDIRNHTRMCGGNFCIFVDMDNMNLLLCNVDSLKRLFPIYINETGTGPKGSEIGKEFNLNHEKLHLAIKNFVCNDFQIN